jgi:hypothetical protein
MGKKQNRETEGDKKGWRKEKPQLEGWTSTECKEEDLGRGGGKKMPWLLQKSLGSPALHFLPVFPFTTPLPRTLWARHYDQALEHGRKYIIPGSSQRAHSSTKDRHYTKKMLT